VSDLRIRPLAAGEEDLFLTLPDPGLVGFAWAGRSYTGTAADNQYRPEWTWVAQRDGAVVARAAWWGGPQDSEPKTLDWLDFGTDVEAGAALLRAAPFRCEYCLLVRPGWRDVPDVRAEAERRIAAAEKAGMRPLVERLRYVWTPACGLPERPGRLSFRTVPDDDAVLDVLRRIDVGTLDAHARRDIARLGPEAAAREDLAVLRWFPSPREWWRLAYAGAGSATGSLVGITVPSRNYSMPVIGFVGVVPEQRGHRYAYDLLVEATHRLVAEGADRIGADTDTTNTPMAATFGRAGYPLVEERVYLDW
jgi:hypothetical protein